MKIEKGKSMFLMSFLIMNIHAIRQNGNSMGNKENECIFFLINKNYYTLQDQYNISGIPADMSIEWKTGKLYFTVISNELKMNLQTLSTHGVIERIKVDGLGQSTAIDNLNDRVYLATDNGVYKYRDGNTELYTALGEDVMYIAVTPDGATMYIATWPQNRVHRITNNGQSSEAYTAVPNGHGLAIDERENIYFIASKTSYILKHGYRIPIKIQGLPKDNMTGIFVSSSNKVYGIDEDSNIYIINPDSANAANIGSFNISGVNTFAMDVADNIFIGVNGIIFKFTAHSRNPCLEINNYEYNLLHQTFSGFK